MRIMCFVSTLQCGGSERVMTWLANNLSSKNHNVSLCTASGEVENFYTLNSSVTHIITTPQLTSSDKKLSRLIKHGQFFWATRQLIKKINPDVIISFGDMTNLRVLISTLGLGLKVIISDRDDPYQHQIKKIYKPLRKFLYPTATFFIAQTNANKKFYSFIHEKKIKTIPNPAFTLNIQRTEPSITSKIILSVGRLCYKKNHAGLIKAFHKIHLQYPEWKLKISGEGEMRKNLELLIKELQLTEKVSLAGSIKDIAKIYIDTGIFAFSSLWEGFPNVLVEAMSFGLPIISTKVNGATDLIKNGENGLLVENDIDSIADALAYLIDHPNQAKKMGQKALEDAETLSEANILNLWEDLLLSSPVLFSDHTTA